MKIYRTIVSEDDLNFSRTKLVELSKMIVGLKKYLEKKDKERNKL